MKRANEIIEKIFENIPELKKELTIFESWKSIVGDNIDKFSRPIDINGNALIVAASHPAAAQAIRLNEREILKNIENSFGILNIRKIQIQLVDNMLIKKNSTVHKEQNIINNEHNKFNNRSFPQRSFEEILDEFRKRAK